MNSTDSTPFVQTANHSLEADMAQLATVITRASGCGSVVAGGVISQSSWHQTRAFDTVVVRPTGINDFEYHSAKTDRRTVCRSSAHLLLCDLRDSSIVVLMPLARFRMFGIGNVMATPEAAYKKGGKDKH